MQSIHRIASFMGMTSPEHSPPQRYSDRQMHSLLPDGGLRIDVCTASPASRRLWGGKQIVTVQQGKELAVSLHEPYSGHRAAAIFLMEHANALILCRIFLAECTALIRGSVIDQ